MSDDLTKRFKDKDTVSSQSWEISDFLKKHPEISQMTLQQAKDAAGDSTERLERWLRDKGYLS